MPYSMIVFGYPLLRFVVSMDFPVTPEFIRTLIGNSSINSLIISSVITMLFSYFIIAHGMAG